MNVLYLSYDGALDPLGRSQILPYLEGLSKRGHSFDLISFEKPRRFRDVEDRQGVERRLRASSIRWHPLRYHSRFSALATAYDLARGLVVGAALTPAKRIDLIHARSYPATLIAWSLSRAFGIPFIFDMRGLYADERTDGGIWPPGGTLYRMTKSLERVFLRDARGLVTLTHASVPTLLKWLGEAGGRATPTVIPTCVDTERFRPPATQKAEGFTFSYVGSIGTWYLLDEMLAFGRCLLDTYADARLRFITNNGADEIREGARRHGIDGSRLLLSSVPHEEVPRALAGSAATLHFIRPTFSKQASAATKFAESLALGLPVVLNPGIGDVAQIARERGVGVILDEFKPDAFLAAARAVRALAADPGVAARCRQTAIDYFSLSTGVERYAALYEAVTGQA